MLPLFCLSACILLLLYTRGFAVIYVCGFEASSNLWCWKKKKKKAQVKVPKTVAPGAATCAHSFPR